MARDKTDKTDKSPPATTATTATREEIETALDGTVLRILPLFRDARTHPGWRVLLALGPGWIPFADATTGEERFRTPYLREVKAAKLVKMAERNPHAFDAASYLAGLHIASLDTPRADPFAAALDTFPASLRMFSARVLTGELKRPPQPGRPPVDDVLLRLWQYLLCRFVAECAPLDLSPNRERKTATFTACDAVAEAFTRAGHNVTVGQMATLCYHAAFSDLRALAEALDLLDFSEIE